MAEPAAIDLPGRDAGATGGDHPAGELHLAPDARCFICTTSDGELVETFGKWMCRDRVPCYQRWLGKR